MRRELILNQDTLGYRYNRDSFLLADFFRPEGVKSLIDIGAGVGVVSILIGRERPELRMIAIEIQEELARQATQNARSSGVENYHVVAGDALQAVNMFGEKSFDSVICNPPYKKAGSGRLSRNSGQAVARHEVMITLKDIVRLSSKLLRPEGSISISMVYDRRREYMDLLHEHDFFETRYREVKPLPDGPVNIFLSEARLDADWGCSVEAPLVLRSNSGQDSDEFKRIVNRYA